MIDNPWRVESVARGQRERLQEEMKQIRLEEAALESRVRRPNLLRRAWLVIRSNFEPRKARLERPVRAVGVKRPAGV